MKMLLYGLFFKIQISIKHLHKFKYFYIPFEQIKLVAVEKTVYVRLNKS